MTDPNTNIKTTQLKSSGAQEGLGEVSDENGCIISEVANMLDVVVWTLYGEKCILLCLQTTPSCDKASLTTETGTTTYRIRDGLILWTQ